MGWKATGVPLVRRQRDKWVVRVDGIDTASGKHRPRQVGTYASKRTAEKAVREYRLEAPSTSQDTVGSVVRRWVESRTDITKKSQEQYRWAAGHIDAGLGGIALGQLDRDDIAAWFDQLAAGGDLSRRSIQIFRNVLKAALREAVDEGLISRSPAARVPLPRTVAKPPKVKEVPAWDADEIDRFLEACAEHRWAIGFRLGVLYGLRRSEVLALRWDDVDSAAPSIRIDEGLVSLRNGIEWTEAKNERSRRTIPLDADTWAVLQRRRAEQATERLLAGERWQDNDLIIATQVGTPVIPRNYDRFLRDVIDAAELPRLGTHGLRHTAATQMVSNAHDLGELRAVADLLGHSPEVLMKTYAHALPNHTAAVVERLRRGPDRGRGNQPRT
ncbi:MAG: tyrosine-type recombinase/integrase [Actinomycetota bacterium]